MDSTWIPQKYETVPGGFSSAVTPDLLPPGQFAWGFNAAIRGGKPHTRPPFVERMVLPDGLVQGADYFGVQGGMIVAAIAGHFYRLRIGNNLFSWQPITLPWYNSPTMPQVWMQQTIESLVIQDFQSDAVIYNGSTARRAAADEVPRGRMMAYGNGRLWVAINNKELVAGDIRTRTPGSELKFTETNYLTGGGALYFPRGLTGLEFIPVTGAADFGTLMLFANDFAESIRADVTTRNQWGMPGFITTVFRDVGCAGDWSIVQVNQDLYWRDGGGNIRSLQNGISTNSGPGSYPISREVSRLVDYDSPELLPFCSSIHFDNRLLMTSSPYLNRLGGVSFKNIVALDFSPISTNQLKAPPGYDAQWTGIPGVVKLITGNFDGRPRAFAISSDESGTNRLWEILKSGRDDVSISCGSGTTISTPIQSFVEYPSFDFQAPGRRKRIMRLDVWLTELIGDLELTAYWHADNTQKWYEWDAIETCAKVTDASVANPHVWKNLLPQQRTQIKTFTIPDDVDDITKYAEQIGFEFQIRLAWRGHCQIERMIAYAVPVDDTDYANRENLVTECLENNISGNEISYVIPTTADYMHVNVPEAFVSSGEPGGPFTPSSITYRISNPGVGPIDWTLALSETWLQASSLGGTLQQGEFVDVVVSLSAVADTLPASASPYTGTISFTNTTNGCGDVVLDASLTVALGAAPSILSQPASQTIFADGSAAWGITADGTAPLSYQWEYSPLYPVAWAPLYDGDGVMGLVAGATTPSLSFDNVPLDQNNHKVRCRVRNAYGMAVSNGAALYVLTRVGPVGPTIVSGPADQSVYPGNFAFFAVDATGAGTLLYQWQFSTDGGATWSDQVDDMTWSGATTNNLSTFSAIQGDSNKRFRCIVTDDNGSIASNSALLRVTDPIITRNPDPVADVSGAVVTFTVYAMGATALSYQWERSQDGGVVWSLVGTNNHVLSWTIGDLLQDGNLFRCRVTDLAGEAVSLPGQLSVFFPATPFSVTYDPPALVSNSIDTPDLTSDTTVPTFGGGYSPFYVLTPLNNVPLAGVAVNDEGDYSFSVTISNGTGMGDYGKVYMDSPKLQFIDEQGQKCWGQFLVGMFIAKPAGANMVLLGDFPLTGSGFGGSQVDTDPANFLPSLPPTKVATGNPDQVCFDPPVPAEDIVNWNTPIINGVDTGLFTAQAPPISYQMRCNLTDPPLRDYQFIWFCSFYADLDVVGRVYYATNMSPITITLN